MSSASVSPHGFQAVRGRGYRPEQVDEYAEALSEDRDAAWERAARLTVLARQMDAELERLREAVAGLVPQTYESLGERARRLLDLAQEEAAAVREGARREARQLVDGACASAAGVRESAQAHADVVRADADERARQRLLAARAEADEIRAVAGREAGEQRGEALAALREMGQRTSGMLAEQAKEHAERWAELDEEYAARAAALDAHHAEAVTCAEGALTEAEQAFADADDSARDQQEEAAARAAELLAEARGHAESVEQETQRVLREHAERADDVRAHIDRVHTSLTAWAGRATAE
ncbi:DivIVA domain-containing protein [Streptomyces coeruleorubidus]|uniref:DivIVA domain-containing protein n=1 Tax=Streptomyces coeruleorubidus TaxID=116188 RepID=UPI0036BE5297